MKRIVYLLFVVVLLAGCKSSKHLVTPKVEVESSHYLTSKLQLTIPGKKGEMTLGGTMKMKMNDRIQISLLMPFLRTEVARIEVSSDECLIVDRLNKRFVRASKGELNNILPKKIELSRLEKLLMDASLPNGKAKLTGKELGIPSLEKGKIELYDFSSAEFLMVPTQLASKYQEVPLEELVKILVALL